MIDIGAGIPTYTCIRANAHALARYAALCQAANIVPIVEPEVLMDGDHDIDRCYEVTELVLKTQFEELYFQRVALEGMVLKPNMAISGKKSAEARRRRGGRREDRARCCKNCVPGAVPGIAFLSGGQSDEEATAHLDTMNKIGDLPWRLTFSYGRALQHAPQQAWSGKSGERRRGAARVLAPRAHERPRLDGPVEAGPGEEGGVTAGRPLGIRGMLQRLRRVSESPPFRPIGVASERHGQTATGGTQTRCAAALSRHSAPRRAAATLPARSVARSKRPTSPPCCFGCGRPTSATLINRVKTLASVVQPKDVALVLDGQPRSWRAPAPTAPI